MKTFVWTMLVFHVLQSLLALVRLCVDDSAGESERGCVAAWVVVTGLIACWAAVLLFGGAG